MMTYDPGTVVLLHYPFTTGSKAKSRPVLVLLDSGDADFVVAKMTSKISRSRYDVVLRDWQAAGLRAPTIVRLDKLLTTEKAIVRHVFGSLSPSDHNSVASVLATLFSGW